MRGVITGRDVFLHSVDIVRLFGVSTYLQCLWAVLARRSCTFLGVVHPAAARARWRPFR
jgi:hypothetical protein